MFLLDTNVISTLRRRDKASPDIVRWAAARSVSEFFLSVITMLELEMGILLIERRDVAAGVILRRWLDEQIVPLFETRILVVDRAVATRCAALHVPDRRSDRDALIAATALVHGMTVVTRNVADFASTGVAIVNPWVA